MLNIKKIKPMYTKMVVTANRYTDNDQTGTIITKASGSVKEYQTVVAIGSTVRDIKVGDVVMINPSRYMRKKYDSNSLRDDLGANPVIDVQIPVIEMDNTPYFLIDASDVDYIIEEYTEENKSESTLEVPKTSLIMPKETKIVGIK